MLSQADIQSIRQLAEVTNARAGKLSGFAEPRIEPQDVVLDQWRRNCDIHFRIWIMNASLAF